MEMEALGHETNNTGNKTEGRYMVANARPRSCAVVLGEASNPIDFIQKNAEEQDCES